MTASLSCILLLASQAGGPDTALDHEWFGRFDRALIAGIAALKEDDTLQRRRDLARAVAEYEALTRVVRIPELAEPPLELEHENGSLGWVPLFEDDRGPKIDVSAGLIAAAWKDLRVFDEATGDLVADPIDLAPLIEKHGGIGQLELNAMGTRVAVAFSSGPVLYVFDLATGSAAWVDTNLAGHLAWSPTEDALSYPVLSKDHRHDEGALIIRRFDDSAALFLYRGNVHPRDRILFSPDGARLALCRDSGRVSVFDTKTGEEVAEHDRRFGGVLTFHPDGDSLILSDGYRPTFARWEFNEPGESIVPISGLVGLESHEPAPSRARGKNYVFQCAGGFVSLDLRTDERSGPPLVKPPGWRSELSALSPSGRFFAEAVDLHSSDHILVWDTDTGKRLGPRSASDRASKPQPALYSVGAIEALDITDAGRIVACCQDGTVRIYNANKLVPIDFSPSPEHETVVTDQAGVVGVTLSEFSTLTLVGNDETAEHASVRLPGVLDYFEPSRDGSKLGCTGSDGGAWVIDIGPAGAMGRTFGTPHLVSEARFDAEHLSSLLGGGNEHESPVPMAEGWQILATQPGTDVELRGDELRLELRWVHGDAVTSAVEDLFPDTPTSWIERWYVDGDRVLGFHKGKVEIVNARTGTQIATIMPFGPAGRCRMAGDRVIMWHGHQARLYDSVTGAMLREFEMERPIGQAAPIPGSAIVVMLEQGAAVARVDLESLAKGTSEFKTMGDKPAVEVSTSGLASVVGEDGSIWMFDARSGKSRMLREPDGHEVLDSRLRSDGERLVALIAPNKMLLFDVETGQVLARHLIPKTEAAGSAEAWVRMGHTHFSANGEGLLLAPSVIVGQARGPKYFRPDDYTVIEAATGERLSSFSAPEGVTRNVTLLGSGEHLLIRGKSTLRLFELSAGDCRETLAIEGGWLLREPLAADEIIVISTPKKGTGWVTQLLAVDIEHAKVSRVLIEVEKAILAYNIDASTPIRALAEGRYWLNTETGHLITGAPTFSEGYDGEWMLAFGPDNSVLLHGRQFGRIVDDQFQRIGRRHWAPLFADWNQNSRKDVSHGAAFIGSDRVLVGALPRQGGLEPVVLDFGPARNEPLQGTPDDLLEQWCERLDLLLLESGEIVPAYD